MGNKDTIEFLENLTKGNFCTVNIPITRKEKIPITAMYIGKDEQGRYNFIDTGRFVLSKEFLEKGTVTIDKEFNEKIALDIHAKVKMEQERKQKHKDNLDII